MSAVATQVDLAPVRFSTLKCMAKSPAHARWAMDHESAPTPQMRFGNLAHAVYLGTDLPIVFPGDRRGNIWKEFKAQHEGKEIVTAEEFQRASDMAAALDANPEAKDLLTGTREKTISFTMNGRLCRATPDAYRGGDDLPDLKSTGDASPNRFPWNALRLGYHAQMAWEQDAIRSAGLGDPKRLFLIAIEVKPPFAVCVYQLTERAEDFGRRTYRLYLEEFLNCERSNSWPAYPKGVLDCPEEGFELVGADGEVIEVD